MSQLQWAEGSSWLSYSLFPFEPFVLLLDMTIRDRLLDMAWDLRLMLVVVELMATTWKGDPCSDQPGDIMGRAVG